MSFQNDGGPAHVPNIVRNFLMLQLPDCWIGKGSFVYLWGRIKYLVYTTRPPTRKNVITRIQYIINNIPQAKVEVVEFSTQNRLVTSFKMMGNNFNIK